METLTYELNIVEFMKDHRDYVIQAGIGGIGYTAQRRGKHGHGVGPRYSELTLDALAEAIERAEKEAAENGSAQ